MLDMAKRFAYITKNYPYLFSKMKSLWKRIVQVGKLINSWVSWNESSLKMSEKIVIFEMIVNVLKNVCSNIFSDLHKRKTGQ